MSSPYKSLFGGPILLPSLSSALQHTLTPHSSSNKIEWERWKILELLRWLVMLVCCSGIWVIRSLLLHIPSPIPASGLLKGLSQGSSLLIQSDDESAYSVPPRISDSAIGRALCQVLALVNDIPVSSEKYEFARTLADKIIQQNMNQGDFPAREVNRVALVAGFARTLKLLTLTLKRLHEQQEVDACSWPWKLIRLLPFQGLAISPQLLSLESIRMRLSNLLFPVVQSASFSELPPSRPVSSAQNAIDCIVAQKLAQELLWITHKLKECSAIEDVIVKWSSPSCLASISLSAHPRVQGSLLRVSVLLFKELACEEDKASRELKFKLLLLWLPLFCCAKNGYDSPIFTTAEKVEVVGLLEQNIMSLSDLEQEMVLVSWLQEYTLSSSDWPNLQQCFENWCHASRKSENQFTRSITLGK